MSVPLYSRFLLAALLLLAVPGARAEIGWHDLNRAVIDGHIVPRYQVLADATRTLGQRVSALCTEPDETALALARDAFVVALDAWNGVSHIRFGPVETDQRYYRFQLWPDRRGTGQRQIAQWRKDGDETLLTPDTFAGQSVAVQGLSALEVLLYPDDGQALDRLAPGGEAGFDCRLTTAIGANLAAMSAAILQDWTTGERPYRDTLLSAGKDQDRFISDEAVSAELLNAIGTTTQVIVQLKLSAPLGTSAETARPKRAESWRSGRSLPNICTSLRAIDQLYAIGFAPRLRGSARALETDREVAMTLAAALESCLGQSGPLYTAVSDPKERPALLDLRDLVGALQSRTGRDLAESLDLTLGFNSLDGD